MIKKTGNKYVLYSKSKKGGHRKRLGTFGSRTAAMKREKQIQYFKHVKENMASSSGAVAFAPTKLRVSNKTALVSSEKGKKKHPKKTPKMANLYQEQVLREAIRKIITLSKLKFYEDKGKEYLEEQKLRMVIRALLNEKAEPTPYNNTGLNTAAEVIQRIKRTIMDTYKSLTTSGQQRQDFIATVEDMVKDAIQQQDLMKKLEANKQSAAPVQPSGGGEEFDLTGLTEEDEENTPAEKAGVTDPETPAIPLTADPAETAKSDQERSAAQAKQIASQVTSTEPDTTGGSKAIPVVSTIVPQILTARDTLKDPKDKELFDLAIIGSGLQIGNIKAFADIAEKEITATIGGGTTAPAAATPATV